MLAWLIWCVLVLSMCSTVSCILLDDVLLILSVDFVGVYFGYEWVICVISPVWVRGCAVYLVVTGLAILMSVL